ncbi:MAG: hypothetical protein QM788_05650 [Roseateles sp.]|uniref:hypothetical protein n=1 Tax=Roseateles sp. TaxID=1971397 RepID=UPI0039EA3C3C
MRYINEYSATIQGATVCKPPNSGGQILTANLPAGWKATVNKEGNGSYTFAIKNSYGADVVKENTGVGLICTAFAGGVGLAVFSYSGANIALGRYAASLAYAGCSTVLDDSWEDGDEEGLPEC